MMKARSNKFTVKTVMLAVLFMSSMLLSGCWNNRDLTEINIVSAFGIDRTEDGKVLVTAQVVEPAAIQSTSSGKGKGGGSQPKPVFVESYEGKTVFEAIRGMLSIVDKKLFLSTARVLILGERLSQNGINEVMDIFQRDHEMEYRMDVLVAKGITPKEILEMETDVDSIPAVYIKGTIENTVSRGTVKRIMLIDLMKDMNCSGKQLSIGQITKAGEKKVKIEGMGVFKDGKLVGWLDPYETKGYLFASNKIKSTIVNIPVDNGIVAMEIMKSKGKIDVEFENGEPAMLTVKVELEANVGDYEAKGKLDSPDSLRSLEEILGGEVKKEIMMALNRTQKDYSSDIFGFGMQVHKYHSQYWKKAKDDWNDIFSKLPVHIEVNAEIKGTGIIKEPIRRD